MNRTRLVLSTALALVAATLVVPGSARADGDPPGTIVLGSGVSGEPRTVQLRAATAQGAVYSDYHTGPGLYLQPRGTSRPTPLTTNGYLTSSAKSMVVYTDNADGGRQHWYDTGAGTTGLTPTTWAGAAPTGGIVLTTNGAVVSVQLQVAATGALSTLGTLTLPSTGWSVQVSSGPLGAVVVANPPSSGSNRAVVAYAGYTATKLRLVDTSTVPTAGNTYVSCTEPNAKLIGCTAGFGGTVFTAPVTGGPASTVNASGDSVRFDFVMTSTALVWSGYSTDANGNGFQALESVPLTGGAVTTSTTALSAYGVVSDGYSAYAQFGTSSSDAGVYKVADASSTPVKLVPLGAAPYSARAVGIAPGGRVAYVDNRAAAGDGWQRTLSNTSGGIKAGAETLVVPGATGNGLDLSGARTSIGTANGQQAQYAVTSPLQPTSPVADVAGLSGTRALFYDDASDTHRVYDLNTAAFVSTPAVGSGDIQALWGDTYLFTTSDNALWIASLASTAPPRQLQPAASSFVSSVVMWGDHAAVSRFGSTSGSSSVAVLDLPSGTSTAVDGYYASSAGAAGYVTEGSVLHSWDGSRTVSVNGRNLVATATAMAWIGADGVVRAAPVPWTTPDVPRSLGNPLAPASVAGGATWTFDLPTSAPLTTCKVTLAKGNKVVRSLPCDRRYSPGGDAVVSWDGKDSTGAAVAPGTYTWRVIAGNADGSLQFATGAAGTVSGTVAVTS